MLPNFKLRDCHGKQSQLADGKLHTEWTEHTTYCTDVPIANEPYMKGSCLIDFIFQRHSKAYASTLVPGGNNNADLCADCKIMLLENAIKHLKAIEGL